MRELILYGRALLPVLTAASPSARLRRPAGWPSGGCRTAARLGPSTPATVLANSWRNGIGRLSHAAPGLPAAGRGSRPAVTELVRSDPGAAGIRRSRCGRGFRYLRPDGAAVRDPGTIARIRSLVIPPAWQDVWICADPAGHIQATGTDAAGRRQYLYHDLWRMRRDQQKHDRMLEFGAALPRIREVIRRHLGERGLVRERVLAAAVQLIDLGFFRPGGEEYAAGNGSFGLATIRRDHVAVSRGQIVFTYTGKAAKHQEQR